LTAKEVPAIATDAEDIAEEDDDDTAMSQAIETLVSRSGRHRKAPKVAQNGAIVMEAKKAKISGHRGHHGHG
jgi:hypothetical protein